MHAKPVLRVVLKMDDRSSRLGDHGRYVACRCVLFSVAAKVYSQMYEMFDPVARKVMQLATFEAQRLNSETIGTGHILLALIAESQGIFGDGMIKFDCDPESVRREVSKLTKSATYTVVGKVPLNLAAKKAVEHALTIPKNETVSRIHLLIGILQDVDAVAVQVLTEFGLSTNDVVNDAYAAIAT